MVQVEGDRARLEKAVERRTSELTRSEDQLRYILKSGNLGYWTLDLSDMRLVTSDICKENFGRPINEPFSYDDLVAAVFEDDRARMQAAVVESIENRTDFNIEYRLVTPQREVRWLSVRGRTSYSADGSPLSMAGVSLDITDRKRNEEHREFLTAELNHRVKNSMVTMQSIAHQTLRNASSIEQARSDLNARLHSLAAAHDVLTRESWNGASLVDIVKGALAPFISSQNRFEIDGPPVWLPSQMSLAMVMALHELATNAVKYGALSNNEGRVNLSWQTTPHEDGAHLRIRWEESGGPTVTTPTRQGFGSRMIERVLSAEFGGSSQLEYRSSGLVFQIDAPLPARGTSS